MICAYCNADKKGTKKHIIPDGILDLFPECDLSIRDNNPFKGDLTIKDVCSECNNDKLGELDAYGKELIGKHSRSHKLNTDWFARNIEYILNGEDTNASYSVFAGLSVNTSPALEHLFGNVKMNICHSPILSDTGFLIPTK